MSVSHILIDNTGIDFWKIARMEKLRGANCIFEVHRIPVQGHCSEILTVFAILGNIL